jgi:A/G-specific adenine glycosylase
MAPTHDPQHLAATLLAWYRRNRRDLPWRRTRDPWAIWVSEVMLQQTRVAAVVPAYGRFLERFPDVVSFAQASDDELLAAWRGLGYYRRARLLREAARSVVAEHDGSLPRQPSEFGRLPGVGAYTKGAVLSIAFGLPMPAIDGNVERVAARLLTLAGDPARQPWLQQIRELVLGLHRHGSAGDLNQALMELGATVCTPKAPSCPRCPWRPCCAARLADRVDDYPRRPIPKPPIEVTTRVCVAVRDGKVLARRIAEGEINEGQLCLPGLGLPVPVASDLRQHLAAAFGLRAGQLQPIGNARHTITRYRILVEAFRLLPAPPPSRLRGGLAYRDPGNPALPWSTVARKVLGLLAKATETETRI